MHRRFTQLAATICLLMVWVSSPLLSAVHVALEDHRFCAEHERLEESVDRHSVGSEVFEGHSELVIGSSSNDPVHEQTDHEGCVFTKEFTRESLLASACAPTKVLVLAEHVLPSFKESTTFEIISLLRVAPKGSPPQNV